jgi:hypothetical protein
MTLIAQTFQRLELLHQQIAAATPGDDHTLAAINNEIEQLVDIMATHPILSIEDMALFAYAATWGGEQGPTIEFSKRVEGILSDAGVNPFLHHKPRRAA